MLRITLHDSPDSLSFQLEGRLVGLWVTELEQCWNTAASIRDDRKAIIDLKDVTFIDDAGKHLLAKLRDDRATFIARDAMTKAIVAEVESGHRMNPERPESIELVGVSAHSTHKMDRKREAGIARTERE